MAVQINTEAVAQSAQRIRLINRRLRDAYSEVDAAIAGLSPEWRSKAGEEAVAALRGIRSRHVEQCSRSVDQFAKFLEERVAGSYENTERKRTSAAAKFR